MKKILLLKRLFSVLFLLFISTFSWAYDFEVNGIYYYKNSDGRSVTVTSRTSLSGGYSGSVTIPATVTYSAQTYDVTSIGYAAFRKSTGLTSITIPESVTSIGNSAFSSCSSLTSITIPESVTSIGEGAFNGCTSLPVIENIRYADTYLVEAVDKTLITCNIKIGTKFINSKAFQDCTGLTSITIPESVTSIGEGAFNGCMSLPVIENIRYADTYLVEAVDRTQNTYNIKTGTRFINSKAFQDCSSFTSITIPESVTNIGYSAFYNCSGLTSITIPNSVTSIDSDTFNGCSGLTSVTIPNSVTSIGNSAFYGCSSLTSITIPNSVTSIGNSAFYGCSSLTSITIPNSVTSIGNSAFSGCSSLTEAEFANVESFCKISFSNNESNPLLYAKHLYINGVEVNDLVIPGSVTSIGQYAFYNCSGLTSVTIPNSVTRISSFAFWGCSGLTSVTIPNSVTSIDDYAFSGCSGLTSVTIGSGVTSIGNDAFNRCKFRTIVSMAVNSAYYSLGSVGFSTQMFNHTMLYVPQNSYWDYVFNSDWYRFYHIKEFAVDEVEARQAYMLADTDGTNFTVYNAASDKLVTKEYMHQVDETNLGSNWVAEPCGAGMALLNLGAEKYAQISNDGKISLSDTPQELNIEFNDGVATANGRQMMLVLNDDDDITDVVTLRYTPSASGDSFDPNASIYDLMGRRLSKKPTSGYYIQGGKKYFVK